jgi:hypothetical protein
MSTSLVILPIDQGELELRNIPFTQPVVLVGEFRNRLWQRYETWEPGISAGRLSIPIDADRVTCILMLCEKGKEEWTELMLKRRLRL